MSIHWQDLLSERRHSAHENSDKCVHDILELHELTSCKPGATTGSQPPLAKNIKWMNHLTKKVIVNIGALMWPTPLRYDIFYAVKELSRALACPTQLDLF